MGALNKNCQPSYVTKETARRPGRSVSRNEYYEDVEDEENESPTRQFDSRKQLEVLERKSDFIRRRLKLARQDEDKESYFFSEDKDNEVPSRCLASERQTKAPDRKDDSNYELFREFLKFTGRDSSKGNDIPDKDVKLKGKCDRRRKADDCYGTSPERHHVSNQRNYGWMKLEKFNGEAYSGTFLMQFYNCADHNLWDKLEKLQYLRWSLTGSAAQMLWGTEGISFDQLVARLRSRFGSQEMELKYEAELQCRRRHKGEDLTELAQDIRRLMILAYSDDRSPMSQRLAKEHFITAIDDPELELKLREKEPQTLVAAVMYAQRLETFKYSVR